MAGVEIASAWLTIVPSLKGATKQITAELSGVDTSAVGSKIGGQLSGAMGKAMNLQTVGAKLKDVGGKLSSCITKPAAIAGAALGAITIGPGLKRLTDIDTAQAKLKGLGLSAESVQSVMDSALKSVKGTAYGLGDAATVAAGLAAAGVQQGDQMTKMLTTVADVAAASGRSLTDVGTIFNSVAARGKLQGDDMLQLMSSGVPVLSLLGKHLGKTSGEISDMVSKGQIDFQTFADAMQEGLGGSAQATGETFTGAFNNLKAALGRVGADLLSGVFPALKDGFSDMTEAIDGLGPAAKNIGAAIGPVFAQIVQGAVGLVTWFSKLPAPVQMGVAAFVGIAAAIGPGLIMLGKLATGVGAVISIVPKLVAGFQMVGTAFKALGTAFAANPLGLVITLIGAVVAALIWFFTQTETGRQMWASFMQWLGEAWANIAAVATTVWTAIADFFTGLWQGIVTGVTTAWNAITAFLAPVFQFISTIVTTYVEIWKNIFIVLAAVLVTIWNGIVAVVTTVWNAIVAFLTPIVQGIANFIMATISMIESVWSAIWGAIASFFTGVWNGMVAFFTPVIQTIQSVIAAVLGTIQGIWNSVWGAVSGFFSSIWNGMVNAIGGFIGRIGNVIGTIRGTVMGVLGNVGSWLLGAGGDLVRGFWNGISGMSQWLWNQVSGFFNGVVDWAKGVLGIHSPSRVFRFQVGQMVGEGLALGLDDSESTVRSSMDALLAVPDVPSYTGSGGTPATAGAAATNGWPSTYAPVTVNTNDPMLAGTVIAEKLRGR
jgi:tape measure domain-containing protein